MNEHIAPPSVPAAGATLGTLSARIAPKLLAAAGDLAIVLKDGIIVDMATSTADWSDSVSAWLGRAWVDVVTIESRPKIEDMLAAAAAESDEPARWRQVNHPAPGGDLPVRYLAMGTGRRSHVIAIGRDMRATAAVQQRLLQTQQSLERDYMKLRQTEARYRLLFDLAAEPVLIVDAETRRIREANPAAYAMLGAKEGALVNQPASAIVDRADEEAFVAFLGAAAAVDAAPPTTVQLALGRGEADVSASLFRQARSALLFVRLAPHSDAIGTAIDSAAEAQVRDVVDRMPDGFVLADQQLNIVAVNGAFIELAHIPAAERAKGMPLGAWLGRPGIDLDLIVGQLREHGSVRNVATIIRSATSEEEQVEVSAVASLSDDAQYYGFTIRSVGRRLRDIASPERNLPRSVEQLTELVGRMPLRDIVRESTDLIERLCIEAALSYTSDNRASAAEILGVSRQSLYSKLHRHGLGNLVPAAED